MANSISGFDRSRLSPPLSTRGERAAAPAQAMAAVVDETRSEAGEIFKILGASKGLIFVFTLLFVGLAVAYCVLTPKVYKATSAIVIDVRGRPSATEPDQALNGSAADIGLIETQVRLIASPSVLRRVVKAFKLDADPEFNGTLPSPLAAILAQFGDAGAATTAGVDPMAKAIENLGASLTLRRSERSYVVELDVQARVPERAKELADAVAQAYVDDIAATRGELAGQDMTLITQRLNELRVRVDETSKQIADFKMQNGLVDANGRDVTELQLSTAVEDLTKARDRTTEAKSRYEQIQRLLKAGRPLDAVGDALRSTSLERLRGQLADLTRQKATLSTTLGERHPAMAEVENQLRDVRQLIAEEISRIGAGAANEYQVARDSEALSARRVEELRRTIDQRANTILQLRSLEREGETTRLAYERYLKARETNSSGPSAIIARIIQMAILPVVPSAPKKGPALAIGLFMGLFVGVLAALLRDFVTGPARPALVPAGPALRVREPDLLSAPVRRVGREPVGLATGADGVLVELPRKAMPVGRRAAADLQPDYAPRAYAADATYHAAVAHVLASLALARRTGVAQRVLVTSFSPGTGKTLLAFTLAQQAAQQGIATVLIEGNTEDPMLDSLVPESAKPGVLGLFKDQRVGYLLDEDTQADLCIVPILENEAGILRKLKRKLGRKANPEPLMTHANLIIFDGGVISNPDVLPLAQEAQHVLVVVGPADRATLRQQDPVRDLGIHPSQLRGLVGSPVDALNR